MTFTELLIAIGVVAGLLLGAKGGHDLCGVSGAVVGGIIGPVLGYYLARFPEKACIALQKRRIRSKGVEELHALLNPQDWQSVDLVLLELKRRGVDITGQADLLFSLMASEHIHERLMGKRTFDRCFPERIHVLAKYSPFEDASICREKLSGIAKQNI
jgi:hypothetical protein